MERGYVKFWRKSVDSGFLQNPNLFTFWSWCLLKASHKSRKQMVGMELVELSPGDFIFGRKSASVELKMSEQTIRTCLNKLKKLENLTTKATNKFTVITIINWGTYQGDSEEVTSSLTSSQPASNQQVTSSQPAANHKQECNHLSIKESLKDLPDSSESGSQKFYLTRKKKKLTGKRLESFEAFWEVFNWKKDKASAADSWLEIPSLNNQLVETIITSAKFEAMNRPELISKGTTPKWAQGWLTARRWEDESPANQNPKTPEEIRKQYGF